MIKLLFVEDNEASVRDAIKHVEKDHKDVECVLKDFDDAKEWMKNHSPDIVSLDVVLDGMSAEARLAGQPIYDMIWKDRFCPIIVYSAQPHELEIENASHPFLKQLKKGSGSPAKFSKTVGEFRPHVDALREAELQVRREFTVAMRDLAPSVFEQVSDEAERRRIITRSGRRRLAAQMDDFSDYEGKDAKRLAPWEHYLCPPVSDDLLLGDILQASDGDAVNPDSFRIVLTPSCDLVSSGGRSPKVENVLVAKCIEMKSGLARVGTPLDSGRKKVEKKLKSELSQGFIQNILPFPKFANRIPTMAADLRQLELIRFGEIGNNGEFRRVASIDSPFRELISWAHMQTACRPGLPDRDIESWSKEIGELYVQASE